MDQHEHGVYDEMQPCQGFGQSLIVSSQPAEAVEPAKAAFDHPAARQQNEALFRLRQLDDPKINAFLECSLRGFFAGVSQVVERHLNRGKYSDSCRYRSLTTTGSII